MLIPSTLCNGCFYGTDQIIHAQIIETHPIDDAARFRHPKQAWLRVPWLRSRGDGADLNEAKAQIGQAVDTVTVLVQTRCEPNRVGELNAHDLTGTMGYSTRPQLARTFAQHGQGELMGMFSGQGKQQRSGEGIQHRWARISENRRHYSQRLW